MGFHFDPQGPMALGQALFEGRLVSFCPCNAVVGFRIPQRVANMVPERFVASGVYRQIPEEALLTDNSAWKRLQGKHKTTIFARADVADDLAAVQSSPEIQEYLAIPEIVNRLVDGADSIGTIDRRLFLDPIECGFLFLGMFGLVDSYVIQERFAHSSLIMIVRNAIGIPDAGHLVRYLGNPPWFMSQLFTNSLTEGAPGNASEQLYGAFREMAGELRCDGSKMEFPENGGPEVSLRLTPKSIAEMVSNLKRYRAPYFPSLDSALSDLEGFLPIGGERARNIHDVFRSAAKSAVEEHRSAGRTVYGLDEAGNIVSH